MNGAIERGPERYERLMRAVAGQPLPLALVDLDAFDRNLDRLVAAAAAAKKTLRLASKSIRCSALIRRAYERGRPTTLGLMAYSASELAFLSEQGFDDLLLAYPSAQTSDVELLARLSAAGKKVAIVADDREQLEPLAKAATRAGCRVRVALELDLSLRPIGDALNLGVWRSPLSDARALLELAQAVRAFPSLELAGVMGYEAQIAGLTDHNPFTPLFNPIKQLVKRASRPAVLERRRAVRDALAAAGFVLDFYNGGGTGSLSYSAGDDALTEVTAGSGLLGGHLFDYYEGSALEPAAYFALQVVRRPGPRLVTCHGGGYVASGEAGPDRLPRPVLPEGLALVPREGAGEVQTPLLLPQGISLPLGAPVFWRHAKSGELAERFDRFLLVRGDKLEEVVPTYRGEGRCFL